MSSDSVRKSSSEKNSLRKLKNSGGVVLTLIIFMTLISCFFSNSKNNEIFLEDELIRARKEIPEQCTKTLDFLIKNQQKSRSSSPQTIVFACHRKWCDASFGHCEDCSGIGDRTRHLLSMITLAMDRNINVEIDYPLTTNSVKLSFSALEYRDPFLFLAEFFRFRSYDVSDQGINLNQWGNWTSYDEENRKNIDQFVHFIPKDDVLLNYDPCLYHALFRPTNRLQNEITYYYNLFHLDTNNVLGIHFRTGDLTAFGVQNKDVRAKGSSLEQCYHRMLRCAEALALQLDVSPMDDHNGIKKLNFFLATDNQHIKDIAKKEERYMIYLTSDKPSAYLRSEGDKSAFLELYLLSKTRGLVINQRPKDYNGPAEKLSTFADLAKKIGFMSNQQVMSCSLD